MRCFPSKKNAIQLVHGIQALPILGGFYPAPAFLQGLLNQGNYFFPVFSPRHDGGKGKSRKFLAKRDAASLQVRFPPSGRLPSIQPGKRLFIFSAKSIPVIPPYLESRD